MIAGIAGRLVLLAGVGLGLPYLFACVTSAPAAAPAAASALTPGVGGDQALFAPGAAGPAGGAANASTPTNISIDPSTDPSIPILEMVIAGGTCRKLERMPGLLSRLPDAEFRIRLDKVVGEGRRRSGAALTEWLVLASKYQEICQLRGAPEHDAAKYIEDSIPMEESVMEAAVKNRRCGFLAEADANQAWPYEARLGNEVLQRDFNEAEITRQLWKTMLEDYLATCGAGLSKRAQIRAESVIRRLDRIIGLDDPTLITMRSNMLAALEKGNEQKVLTYAKVIAERESALDSRRAGEYEAKLASIAAEMKGQQQAMAAQGAAITAAIQQAKAAPGVTVVQGSANVAETAANVAETAANVAKAAKAAKTGAQILRSFF